MELEKGFGRGLGKQLGYRLGVESELVVRARVRVRDSNSNLRLVTRPRVSGGDEIKV